MDTQLRGAFFDLGGTLVDAPAGDDPWRPVVMANIAQAFGPLPWAEALYDAHIQPATEGPDALRQETNKWIAAWLRDRGEPWDDAEVERLRVAFGTPLPEVFGLAPGAEPALRWCKARGLFVAILTNTYTRDDAVIANDCKRLGLAGLVDFVVSSYSTGWSKPHPAMFERALAAFGLAPREAFMVGDDFAADVIGAKSVGMRAIWKSTQPEPDGMTERPDAVIESLAELPRVVQPWMVS